MQKKTQGLCAFLMALPILLWGFQPVAQADHIRLEKEFKVLKKYFAEVLEKTQEKDYARAAETLMETSEYLLEVRELVPKGRSQKMLSTASKMLKRLSREFLRTPSTPSKDLTQVYQYCVQALFEYKKFEEHNDTGEYWGSRERKHITQMMMTVFESS